jgi:hypothetical protein
MLTRTRSWAASTFRPADLPADHGLRDVRARLRPAEAQLLDNGHERLEGFRLHQHGRARLRNATHRYQTHDDLVWHHRVWRRTIGMADEQRFRRILRLGVGARANTTPLV